MLTTVLIAFITLLSRKISLNKSSLFHIILLIVSTLVLHKPIAKFLIGTDSQQPSEAIVILGGGLGLWRIIHAVKLYGKGLASIIILTGQEMEFDVRKVRFKDIKLTEPKFAGILVKLYGIPEDTPLFNF